MLPSAGVYEAGRSAELCRTPCSFDIDPGTDAKRTYVVRATTSGTFRTSPTHAEEMYEPEVFGRTGSDVVTVQP